MHHPMQERRSRWVIRAMEWDDHRARYPNVWHEGMPRNLMAFERVAGRLRMGDLIASYYPASQRYSKRSERFLGISRVIGLRRADRPGFAWIDLETAHRFDPPLRLDAAPRRVFLCCDPGWPEPEVALFRQVFDAAVSAGWKPTEEELEGPPAAPPVPVAAEKEPSPSPDVEEPAAAPSPVDEKPTPDESAPAEPPGRMFAGADYGGDMRDPRQGTWLAILELRGERLRVSRLEPTGRSGLQSYLRDPDRALMHVEAIGLDFPFGLPTPFAETLLGGEFPEEGWWALVHKLEKLSRPDYLAAGQEFRDSHGELRRFTDEQVDSLSPLHRDQRDLTPMVYHGIRMIAEDRSRYAVKPFESAKGKLLLEVCPDAFVKKLALSAGAKNPRVRQREIVSRLGQLDQMPVDFEGAFLTTCQAKPSALDAVLAARCAAVAVLTGEVNSAPEELAPERGEQVRREGWIYGLQEPGPAPDA